jgi:hypothetical protein
MSKKKEKVLEKDHDCMVAVEPPESIVMVNKPAVLMPQLQVFLSHCFTGTILESLFPLIFFKQIASAHFL